MSEIFMMLHVKDLDIQGINKRWSEITKSSLCFCRCKTDLCATFSGLLWSNFQITAVARTYPGSSTSRSIQYQGFCIVTPHIQFTWLLFSLYLNVFPHSRQLVCHFMSANTEDELDLFCSHLSLSLNALQVFFSKLICNASMHYQAVNCNERPTLSMFQVPANGCSSTTAELMRISGCLEGERNT